MTALTQRLQALSSANEFLEFFGIAYERSVVDVNRLHILKRFQQYVRSASGLDGLDDIEMFRRYREMLQRAYLDFTVTTAVQEKLFKVFQDAEGEQHVSVDALRDSLAERRIRAAA